MRNQALSVKTWTLGPSRSTGTSDKCVASCRVTTESFKNSGATYPLYVILAHAPVASGLAFHTQCHRWGVKNTTYSIGMGMTWHTGLPLLI